MPETLDHNWLLTSQLRSMRYSQLAHAEKLGRLAGEISSLRQLVHHLLEVAHLTRHGPPSSSAPNPSPTPSPTRGKPSSILSPNLMRRVKGLGEWVVLAMKVAGLIKWVGVILPSLWLAAIAVWKLALPYLSRLLHSL